MLFRGEVKKDSSGKSHIAWTVIPLSQTALKKTPRRGAGDACGAQSPLWRFSPSKCIGVARSGCPLRLAVFWNSGQIVPYLVRMHLLTMWPIFLCFADNTSTTYFLFLSLRRALPSCKYFYSVLLISN
jgi:hypothetical protein